MGMSRRSKARGSSRQKQSSRAPVKISALRAAPKGTPRQQRDVVFLEWPYYEGGGKGSGHYALVLSDTEFNWNHPWGILALITTDFEEERSPGEYMIASLQGTGLTETSIVAPLIQSANWDSMEPMGELSASEFKRAVAKLKEALPL